MYLIWIKLAWGGDRFANRLRGAPPTIMRLWLRCHIR